MFDKLPCLSVEFGKHREQPQPPDQEQETDDTADDEHYFRKYVPLSIPEQHVGCHDGTAQQNAQPDRCYLQEILPETGKKAFHDIPVATSDRCDADIICRGRRRPRCDNREAAQQPYDIEDDQIRHLVQKSYDR